MKKIKIHHWILKRNHSFQHRHNNITTLNTNVYNTQPWQLLDPVHTHHKQSLTSTFNIIHSYIVTFSINRCDATTLLVFVTVNFVLIASTLRTNISLYVLLKHSSYKTCLNSYIRTLLEIIKSHISAQRLRTRVNNAWNPGMFCQCVALFLKLSLTLFSKNT